MKKFLLLATLAAGFASLAFADESIPDRDRDGDHHEGEPRHFSPAPPEYTVTPDIINMRYCLTVGVRAAWGAQARFLGAPATFKYIPEKPLQKMFMGDPNEIPNDAIYVLDELNLDQRRSYEESAFYGWKQADKWIRDGRERQDYEVLSAIFYQGCKKELTSGIK
jgi:hypothetical protein